MGISEADIRQYVSKACALVDGAPLDYLTVNVPSSRTARSFQEHAKVLIGDSKSIQQVCDETWGHIEDIISSASQEGKSEAVIRINLYRAKAPAGSRTYRTDTAPMGGHSDDDELGNIGSVMGAIVATNRDLRIALKDQLDTINRAAGEGWKIAGNALKELAKAKEENAELMVVVASQHPEDNTMKQLALNAGNAIIQGLQAKAAMQMQQDMMNKQIQTNNTEKKD